MGYRVKYIYEDFDDVEGEHYELSAEIVRSSTFEVFSRGRPCNAGIGDSLDQ